jgi:hypothetical protein
MTGVFEQVYCLKLDLFTFYIHLNSTPQQHKYINRKIILALGLQMTEKIREGVKGRGWERLRV